MSHAPINKLLWWSELESNQPFGLFRPALIHLSYPTRLIADCQFAIAELRRDLRIAPQSAIGIWQSAILEAPLPFVMHLLHDFTIIVHVHEQVLAPFGSRLCIVTKHYAFELHAQCRLRSQQWHSCFFRR